MRISILCSDSSHPVNKYLEDWVGENRTQYDIELVRRKKDLSGGDILFLVSCSEIMNERERSAYVSSLVLHASDLPLGRGWNPHIWKIIEGGNEITLSLLEAEDKVDSGRIWKKLTFKVPKDALWDEINDLLFTTEIELIDFAVKSFNCVKPQNQDENIEPTYYPRRKPRDSKIDPYSSIASQFNKIRVCDPDRFPAFFEMHGRKYKVILEKFDE